MDLPSSTPDSVTSPITPGNLSNIDAVLFDLDGVLTPTAITHMHAWAALFTDVFARHSGAAPYTEQDYFTYLDGKPRYDGVAALLKSREIQLPQGDPTDLPTANTVCGLGNRKNLTFTQVLETEGIAPYPGSLVLVHNLIARGIAVAVVSSSRNATSVLKAAGIADLFPVVVDGLVAAKNHIAGKPAPDTYLYAANLVGVSADRAAVVEDAESGVASGRAGNFALVVGVDRGAGVDALLSHGADVVVQDLAELLPTPEKA